MSKDEFINRVMSSISAMRSSNYITPNDIGPKVENFILSYFGISKLNLPSIDNYGEDYLEYLEDIWYMHESNFKIKKPSGFNPRDRKMLMGQKYAVSHAASKWFHKVENSEEWNSGWVSKLPYYERKYLMLVRGFEEYEKNTPDIQIFRISHIPSDVHFQECRPTLNELYIAHPYKDGVYIPAAQYEHLLFRERIHELSKVMMALGATEIRTIQNSGSKSYSKGECSSHTSGSGNFGKWASGSGSYSSSSSHMTNAEIEDEVVINFKNDPLKPPYLPEGLVWFNHESEWQQIADSRLHGNILEYEIGLSSKERSGISNIERSNIEAQAKILLASGSFSRETSSGSIFKEESAKSTRILIRFKSRKDY